MNFEEFLKGNFFTEHLWRTACEKPYFTRVLFLKNRKKIENMYLADLKAYKIIVQI